MLHWLSCIESKIFISRGEGSNPPWVSFDFTSRRFDGFSFGVM